MFQKRPGSDLFSKCCRHDLSPPDINFYKGPEKGEGCTEQLRAMLLKKTLARCPIRVRDFSVQQSTGYKGFANLHCVDEKRVKNEKLETRNDYHCTGWNKQIENYEQMVSINGCVSMKEKNMPQSCSSCSFITLTDFG